jgi:hypothetical protein
MSTEMGTQRDPSRRGEGQAARPGGVDEPTSQAVASEGLREGPPQEVVGGSPGDADLEQTVHEPRGTRSEDD